MFEMMMLRPFATNRMLVAIAFELVGPMSGGPFGSNDGIILGQFNGPGTVWNTFVGPFGYRSWVL